MSVRVERHLGWLTIGTQRYPKEKAQDWQDAINRQLCPFCGEGPFTVVAQHVVKRHDIDSVQLRRLLGLRKGESICDPFYSEACCARIWNKLQARRAHSVVSPAG